MTAKSICVELSRFFFAMHEAGLTNTRLRHKMKVSAREMPISPNNYFLSKCKAFNQTT
jgi:hypothetical protein